MNETIIFLIGQINSWDPPLIVVFEAGLEIKLTMDGADVLYQLYGLLDFSNPSYSHLLPSIVPFI